MSLNPATIIVINRVVGVVSVVVGLAFILGGGFWIHHNHLDKFIVKSAVAEGQVVENIREQFYMSGNTGSHTSYRAIVRFTDQGGQIVAYRDTFAFNPPSFNVGQRVRIFYDPQSPQHAMIDRGRKNYLIPILCGAFGGLMVVGGLQRLSMRPSQAEAPTATVS